MKQKEKVEKLKELYNRLNNSIKNMSKQYLYTLLLQKSQNMVYGNLKYPLNEYDNAISEITTIMNNLVRRPELTQQQINSVNEKQNIILFNLKEYPHFAKKKEIINFIEKIEKVGVNYENYKEVIDMLDIYKKDFDNYIHDYKIEKTKAIIKIKSILYK